MAGHKLLNFKTKRGPLAEATGKQEYEDAPVPLHAEQDEHSPASAKSQQTQVPASPMDPDSYFNSFRSSRTASVYSLSRISFSSQLSQLTALALPNATSLSTSISSISTAPVAASTLSSAAEQISRWLQKATEVLSGLDAEDDVEWAAAGGREGLGEVDLAIGKFEGLIGVYVTAIEDLQGRDDISNVPGDQLKAVVDQMERVLTEWENVRRSLKNVKAQVELAMEWEELWNVVLGDIGLEMENLSRLIFEMEEARHKALLSDPLLDSNGPLDMQELDTIVEEGEKEGTRHRSGLPSISDVTPDSPMSPGLGITPDETSLLALIARLQPLRASLDFLPMTLTGFQTRAESVLPTACRELESKRISLEKKWKVLEGDAEGLRQELGEDRWVVAFRRAGRQALKMCESVERAISKLQESIDAGTQHRNPPLLAKKVEAYEGKKSNYGPAIEKVLSLIGKGVGSRLTVNGEILRLHSDTKQRWQRLENDMKDMDIALDNLTLKTNLRDSISTLMSVDRSGTSTGSVVATPGSSPTSPASSFMGPSSGTERDRSPSMKTSSRRSSIGLSSAARSNKSRRNFSTPTAVATSTQLPRSNPVSRSFSTEVFHRGVTPSPHVKQSSATPTPGARPHRPSLQIDNKPRWNSSPKVDYFEFGQRPRPLPFGTPPSGRRSSMAFRPPTSNGSPSSSGLPLPSPLGRSSPAPSPASANSHNRPRLSGAQTSLSMRNSSLSAATNSTDWVKIKERTPPTTATSKRQSIGLDAALDNSIGESPSCRPRPQRPDSSMAGSRRISMLPLPKSTPSPLAAENSATRRIVSDGHGRQTSLGHRYASNGRENLIGSRPTSKGKENGVMGMK